MSAFISLTNINYILPSGDKLFGPLTITFNQNEKVALIGDNGVGKTTLLKIILGELKESSGTIVRQAEVAHVAQDFYNLRGPIAEVLGIAEVLDAIGRVESGAVEPELYDIIGNKWGLEAEVLELFARFNIRSELGREFASLSGGEKEKLLIIKALLSDAEIIFFDEPTNNLDMATKAQFYELITELKKGVVIISHDRTLLNKMNIILEMQADGIVRYGGNYDFYLAAKESEREALQQKEAFLTGAINKTIAVREKERERAAHKEKYGKKLIDNARFPRIAAQARKDAGKLSLAKKMGEMEAKLASNKEEVYKIGLALKDERIKVPLPDKPFIKELLLKIENLNFTYGAAPLLANVNLVMSGKDRLEVRGANGSGKTTLIKLILSELKPQSGIVKLAGRAIYLDQSLSILERNKSILDNVIDGNAGITINEAYAILANFKFRNEAAKKAVKTLSGGEMLRTALARILGTKNQPELIILDEPTNNLDIKSLEILEEALGQYQGALIVISHDQAFLDSLHITQVLAI